VLGRLALLVTLVPLTSASAPAQPTRPPFGSLIVRGYERAWIVPARGRVVPLARAAALDWSPSLGLLAVAWNGRLSVREPSGRTLWAHDGDELVGAPRWSSGAPVRLAFLAGRSLRVVDRRGGNEVRLGRASDVAPAWRPRHDEIAVVRPDGDVVLLSGEGRRLARWRPPRRPAGLSWTGDARHLVVSLRFSTVVLDPRLEPQATRRSSPILSIAAAPRGAAYAVLLVRSNPDGSQVTTLELRDAERPHRLVVLARADVLSGPIVWSPDARFTLVEQPLQHAWLMVDVRTRRRRELALPRGIRSIFGGLVEWLH
jgi:hypothetical protein